MAIYRNVQLSFWTDNKVEDDFTPEDKYFYLYLLTNPQTNICGCYEISYNQIMNQTGYSKDTINRLFERFDKVHNVIRFNSSTKEILVLRWYKYNWSKSAKVLTGVELVAKHIKCEEFKKYVFSVLESFKNESDIEYSYPAVTSDTDSVSDPVYVSDSDIKEKSKNKPKDLLDELLLEINISDYLLESVKAWLDYKKERRFSYKKQGLKTLLKTISDKSSQFGDEAVSRIINESITSGYQGIIFDKLDKRAGKRINWDNI